LGIQHRLALLAYVVQSAAIKKAWAEHRDERRARISAGLQRYWASLKKSP
jgi:hypothetical protein